MNTPNTRRPICVGEPNRVPAAKDPMGGLISLAWGVLFGLALLKFGNPIVLDKMIDPPTDIWLWLFSPWPVRWGQVTLALLAIGGLFVARFQLPSHPRLLALPALWFGWQLVSATGTVDPALTRITLIHFAPARAFG